MRIVRVALAIALLLLPALSATVPAGAQADRVIHIGVGSFEANAGAYYALDNGFFKQLGLNVDIQIYKSGGAIATAIVSGSLQIGANAPLPVVLATEKGMNMVIIAPGSLYDAKTTPPNFMVAPNSTLRTGKDFEGMTVAVSTLNGLDELGVRSWIDKTGGDSQRVKIVEMPQSLMADAILNGRVSAGTMTDPAAANALSAGKIKVLAPCYTFIGNQFFVSSWFATREWADKNADVVRRFRIAIDRAGAWATRNPQAAAGILHKYLGSMEPLAHERHARSIEPSMIQPIIDAAVRYKIVERPMDARDIIWTGPPR